MPQMSITTFGKMRKRTNIKSIKFGDDPNRQVSENKAVEQVKHRQVVHQEWAKLMAANPPRNVRELGLQGTGVSDLHSVARASAEIPRMLRELGLQRSGDDDLHRIVRALARHTAAPKSAAMPVGRPHTGPTKVTEQCD